MKKLSSFVLAAFLFVSALLLASPPAFASTTTWIPGNPGGTGVLAFLFRNPIYIPIDLKLPPPPANRNPIVANAISKQITTEGENLQFTIPANTFSDPDGDRLTYSISSLPSGVSFNSSSGTISGTPFGSKDYTLTVVASDGRGGSASTSFTLTVAPGDYISDKQRSGEFAVPANLEGGFPFTNYTNKQVTISISAQGALDYVNSGAELRNISPDGIPPEYLKDFIQYFEYPDYTPFSLVGVHQVNPPQVSQLGKAGKLTLPPNGSVFLLANSIREGHKFNTGSFTVQWSVDPS
ncbi:putative Ig domain-containing protein [Scytonema sp. NUACC21]